MFRSLRSLGKKLKRSNDNLDQRDNKNNNNNIIIDTSRKSKSTIEETSATFSQTTGHTNTRDPVQQRPVPNRSVNDFQSKDDLRQALLSNIEGSFMCNASEPAWLFSKSQDVLQDLVFAEEDDFQGAMKDVDPKLDWVLENYDEETTKKQSLSHELRRLLVLKSYLVLDTERKESFDQVTALASKRFNCPICLISLIDLGRQWFLSNRGLVEDVHETPRKLAFCAHAIASTKDCLVVSDATKDARFQDSPVVTGPPGIRFYAGAPLVSPEGYKLGTLCVIDTKPRCFSSQEEQSLINFSAMAVETLVEHRRKMSAWFNNLVKTHFPKFEVSDAGDDDESVASLTCEKEYHTNDDQEFAVFLKTTKRMSLKSLLSLLQSQTRAQNLAPESFQQCVALPEPEETLVKPLVKSFRLQECGENGQVCSQVHIVDSWKHMKKLWWSPEEMRAIQMEAVNTAQYFRTRRPDYIDCVQTVAKGTESQTEVEDTMKRLMEDSHVRGLEPLIVPLLSDNRKAAVKAVVQKQYECSNNIETQSHCLREQSMAYSHLSMRFAETMGQCDQIDALKASMSRWRKNQGQPMQWQMSGPGT